MSTATWVIQVLDDSRNKSIEYSNRFWLRQNVEKLHIKVCVEDCEVDVFDIAEKMAKPDTVLIQDGKEMQKADFHPGKEALLLVKYHPKDEPYVFLYSPKE